MISIKETISTLIVLMMIFPLFAQEDEELTATRMEVAVFQPERQEATAENMATLKLAADFTIEKFAENLGNARMLAVGQDGFVYVTARDEGKVIRLKDTNNDGVADENITVAEIKDVHGIYIHNDQIYLATIKEVFVADIQIDGTLSEPKMIIDDLPDGGQHPNRTLAVGPDNKLYISVGSTCNACEEPNPEHATMLRTDLDGSNREVFAEGLRNTVGFSFHPETQELWGMDHNTDWLGDDEDHEELNKIVEGAHYGWPFVYDDGKKMPHREPKDKSFEEFVKTTTFPELMYQPHSAPLAMVFYDSDQFPDEYKNDAFVAMRGSWNRSEPTGYKVVRIRFSEDHQPVEFEDFLSGFLLENKSHFGRLAGLAVHHDGSLLLSDDANGIVYRISYNGN